MLTDWIPPGQITLAEHPGYAIAIDVLDNHSRLPSEDHYVGLSNDECLHLTNWLACVKGFRDEAFCSDHVAARDWLSSEFGFCESDISRLAMILWRHRHEQRQLCIESVKASDDLQQQYQQSLRDHEQRQRQQDRRIAAEEAAKAARPNPREFVELYSMMSSVAGEVSRLQKRFGEFNRRLDFMFVDIRETAPKAIATQLAKAARAEEIALERAKATTARNEAKLLDAQRKRDEAAHQRAVELVPPQITVIQMTPDEIARASDNRRVYRRF